MLNFSPEKLLLVGILALVVLGPNRLPQAARTLGRVLAEIRKVSGSFQTEVRDALAEPRDALNSAVGDLGIRDPRASVRESLTSAFTPTPPVSPPTTGATATATGIPDAVAGPPGAPPIPDDPSAN